MIIDLQRFLVAERPYWEELEGFLGRLAQRNVERMTLDEARRFHYLYERVSSDLAKLTTFSTEKETRFYLETLVARAYGEIHETRERPHRFRPLHWFFTVFPQTFRRHAAAFLLSVAVTVAGCLFGAVAIGFDPSAKEIVMPFEHLLQTPGERVAAEERASVHDRQPMKATSTAWYIQNNTRVAITTMALGATWGVGTLILLFYNGIMLGAVVFDYVAAGYSRFLVGWLLPHGAVEIPAILLAGQAGFVLASAMIGWGRRIRLRGRMQAIMPDLVTLIGGVAVLLVWAAIVEAFLSQYHEPVIPYSVKIAFGVVELVLLTVFLWKAGGGAIKGEGKGNVGQSTQHCPKGSPAARFELAHMRRFGTPPTDTRNLTPDTRQPTTYDPQYDAHP